MSTQGDGMAEVTGADLQRAAATLNYGPTEQVSPMDREYVEQIAVALAEERQKARAEILRSLTDDSEWARGIALLGEDVALGIDHARRRVEEMAA